MSTLAMSMSLCVDVTVIPSAYVVNFTGACGDGVSDVYMPKSVGDSTPPCGTPFFELAVCLCFSSECGICFAASDVVCDVFDNCVWEACLAGSMSECVHVDCVERPAHVQCHCDCAPWWPVSAEACHDGAAYAVQCCACRVVALKPCCMERVACRL